jgi:uncharacterized phage infection (PIP) family protein YhgE
MTDITGPSPTPASAPEDAREQAADTATVAKAEAANVAASAKDQAAAVASTAAEEAKAVASEAAGEAKDLLADARQQLRAQADEQSEKVASLVGDIGSQLRTMADAGDAGAAKDLVATFADQAEQMSRRLGDGGLDRTLEDARRLARNRPGLFLAGAALAGFVAARVARAADTDSLKQAAAPTTTGNGHGASNGPQLQSASAARPLVADPPPSAGGSR